MNRPDESVPRSNCPNCDAVLVGAYCHECGQKRIATRLTVREFFGDILRRVFRYDKALLHTFSRALRSPGALTEDYLEGRRSGILDPVQYYVSSVFLQFIVVALTRALAPLMERMSALNWLSSIGGIAATRIVAVFVLGGLWQLLYRPTRHNLAENYVFALYGFATVGILWSLLPLIDLAVPAALGESPGVIAAVCLTLEACYFVFAVREYARTSILDATWRIAIVFAIVYGALLLLGGESHWHRYLLPPLPAP